MGRWRKWRALPAAEKRQLLALGLLQPAISLGLHVVGFKRMRGWLEASSRHMEPRIADADDLARAQRLARLAAIAGIRGPVRTTCLRQSLAVWWWLRRRGLQPELKFGVDRLPGAAPDMHAWVELEGVPLAQPGLRHAAFQPAASASTAATTESSAS